MANALVAFENRVDFASAISATSQLNSLPVDNLLIPHVAKPWRSNTASTAAVILDNGTAKTFQVLALFGLNVTAAATFQVRASDSDPTAVTAELYDSGAIAAGQVDVKFRYFIHILSSVVTARYVRVDITDGAPGFIEAGRLLVAPYWQPTLNLEFGLETGVVDESTLTPTLGGQIMIDTRPTQRRKNITFNFVTNAEMLAGLYEIDRQVSTTKDVLFVQDPDSTNLGRDSIWGLLSNQTGIRHNRGSPPRFSSSYTITERL